MSTHHPHDPASGGNAALAARLAELGLAREEFAEAVNSAIYRESGTTGRVTDRLVRYWLDGTHRWPHRQQRDAIGAVLDRTVLELGFIPPPGHSPRRAPRPTLDAGTQPTNRTGGDPDVRRREAIQLALRLAGGVVVTITVPELSGRGHLSTFDVDRLRGPLDELLALDADHGGGAVLAAAAAFHAGRVYAALENHRVSERISRSMYGLAGDYLANAGWFALDGGDTAGASSHLDAALRASRLAGDPMLEAQVWNLLALRARTAGNHAEAYAAAKAAIRSTAARRNPRVAALMHCRIALGHAWRQEPGMANRAIGRAWDALGRINADTASPGWLAFVGPDEIDGIAGLCALAAGQYTAAEAHARAALAAAAPGQTRNQVHDLLTLAEAHAGQHEPSEAAAVAGRALDALDGVQSARVVRRARGLRQQLVVWERDTAAQQWVARFDAFAAA